MEQPVFAWSEDKDASNRLKHGVSFEEAATVFLDDRAILIHDPDHSGDEDRFILLGMSTSPRILVVCHAYRDQENTIRVISARKATRREQYHYSE